MSETYISDRVDERLDRFLVRKQPDLSRSYIQRLIEASLVTVDGAVRKANYKLRGGEKIICIVPPAEEVAIHAEDIPLDILYEDEDMIVVNKARGMVVHPAAGVTTGTLVNALLWHCQDLSGINGALRPGIVHRLDKDTSGVMVAAKNDMAHHFLAQQIRMKDAHREYRAIVHGNIVPRAGVITGDIGRHPTERKKMAIVRENGKPATTHFEVLERFGDYTFIACRLETGRTHRSSARRRYEVYGEEEPLCHYGAGAALADTQPCAPAHEGGDGVYGTSSGGYGGDPAHTAHEFIRR